MEAFTRSKAGKPSAITGTVNTGSGTASSPVGAKLSMGTFERSSKSSNSNRELKNKWEET
jgi:hypothetical protein